VTSHPGQLFAYRGQLLLLDADGQLVIWNGYSEPTWLASLPKASRATLLDGRLYFANRERVGSYDLVRRRLQLETELPPATFVGTPLPLGATDLVVRTSANALLRIDSLGTAAEVSLGPAGSAEAPIQFLADSKGGVIAVTAEGLLSGFAQGGTLKTKATPRCTQPVVLTSTGPGNFVLGCAEGQMYGFGDKAVPAADPSSVRAPRHR
jgi:hypothetical protein